MHGLSFAVLRAEENKSGLEKFFVSSVVKTPCFHCRGYSFQPWSGDSYPAFHVVWPKKKKKIWFGGHTDLKFPLGHFFYFFTVTLGRLLHLSAPSFPSVKWDNDTPATTELSLGFSEKRQQWNITSVQTGNCYFLINDFRPSEESPLPSGVRGSCSSDIWWLIMLIKFSFFFKLTHLHFNVLERM